MKIKIMTLQQINAISPDHVDYGFHNCRLHAPKRGFAATEVYDFWGSILGRWMILVKRERTL